MNPTQLQTFFSKIMDEKSNTFKFIEAHFGARPMGTKEQRERVLAICGLLRETADYVEKNYCKD